MKNKLLIYFSFIVFVVTLSVGKTYAQVGLSVSPPRVYYTLNQGESGSQKVMVTNTSKEAPLNLSVSFDSWKYDDYGNNITPEDSIMPYSCADWMSLPEGSYFSLKAGESKEVEIVMNVPANLSDSQNVQTAMVYFTQMNPVDGINERGANIKINLRSGIKVYRKDNISENKSLEIVDFTFNRENHTLLLSFNNNGNIWVNGIAITSLLNSNNGKEIKFEPDEFYTLPGDRRIYKIALPSDLGKAPYIATVLLEYGDEKKIDAAELQFTYE